MKETIYLTHAGKAKLEEELADLKGPKRDEISRRLKSAIEMGDLSENADYHAAKEDQGFLEGRILEIEATLSMAEITDVSELDKHTVQIGNVVTIQEEGEPEETWTLVGASEANVREQKISYQSPIGSAIMGKKVGQKAEVSLPNGMTLTYKVIQIQ